MNNFLRLSRKYIRPYLGLVWAAILLMFLFTGFAICLPLVVRYMVDEVIVGKQFHLLPWVFAVYLTLSILNALTAYVRGSVIINLGEKVIFRLRRDIYAQLHRLQLSYYDRTQSGRIVSCLINDVSKVHSMVTSNFITYFTDVITLFVVVFILLWTDWRLTLVAVTVVPLFIVNYQALIYKVREYSRRIRRQVDEIVSYITERLSGIRMIKAFGQEKQEHRRSFRSLRKYYHLNYKAYVLASIMDNNPAMISGIGSAAILWYGGGQVLQGRLSIGSLIAFYTLVAYLYNPAVHFSQINTVIQMVRASLDRIYEVLDLYPQIADRPGAAALQPSGGGIRFENVSFSYDGQRQVLQGVDLEIAPGSKVAVVGRSGSGKSTLASLVARFYDPTEGRILIDGQEINRVQVDSLRRQIGIVFQESILFSGSIRDNIAYGNLKASDEEVVRAARAARIHDYFISLPKRYDSVIGERGVSLSGGQKQRVAIARAILTEPRILIFDDCTSSLDAQTESAIQETLQEIMVDHTSIVITHRLSTILDADLIVVLEDGRIVEQGNHETLLERDGLYAHMFKQQFGLTTGGV